MGVNDKNMSKLSSPYILIGILILTIIATGALGAVFSSSFSDDNGILLTNGSTVTAGTQLIDTKNITKVPFAANPENIIAPITNLDVITVFTTLTTGTAPKDVVGNKTYIESNGTVSNNLDGPGVIETNSEGKISIKQPDTMVWGYKTPYTVAVKSGDSIKIVQNKTTIKTVKSSDINNQTIPTDYVSSKYVKTWMSTAKDGQNMTLDYYLGNFNDKRSNVYGKDNITTDFGASTYAYMRNYTSGAPVMVYTHNASESEISNGTSVVQSLSGYPTAIRAANAREFANGWNGTIIPPHTSAHGKENVTFTAIAEADAPSGTATHGVCPAGRSLRAAILGLGYPCPVGMSATEEDAILFNYRPTIDVSVSNTGDYPIQIIMWATGSGGGTTIHTQIIQLKDNASYADYNGNKATSEVSSSNSSETSHGE
jgi:outer membrane lipoprotein-sorting protein